MEEEWLLPSWCIDTSLPKLKADRIPDPTVYLVDFAELKAHGSFPEFPQKAKRVDEVENIDDCFVVFLSHAWIAIPRHARSRRLERLPEKEKVDASQYIGMFEGEVDESSEEEKEERPSTPEACTKEYTIVDTLAGDKYKLYIEALEKLKEDCAPDMESMYVWMDYCCLDQKGRKISGDWIENKSPIESINANEEFKDMILFDRVMKWADCMLTCVYNNEYLDSSWQLKQSGEGLHEDYQAPLWKRYLLRQWCRLEMAYSSNVPFFDDDEDFMYDEDAIEAKKNETKGDVFDRRLNPLVGKGSTRVDRLTGPVQYERLQGRRPHFLYGTRESQLEGSPLLLPVLTRDDILKRFPPTEGTFSCGEDGIVLSKLNKELWPFMRKGEAGYEGERDMWAAAGQVGRKHGQGSMHYPNGNIYVGSWIKNKMEGRGSYSFYQGAGKEPDRYEGSFLDDKQHGEGTYTRADGSMYKGDWVLGRREGFGHYRWADGSEYRGYFQGDERDGYGKFKQSNGNVYEGYWQRGRRHGHGKMVWPDGETYEGEWKDDVRHGQGLGYNPFGRGAEYEGAWKNGMKMGWGKLTIGKRTIRKPQVLQGMFSCDNYIGEDGWEEDLADASGAGAENGSRGRSKSPVSPLRPANGDTIFDLNSDDEAAAEEEAAEADRLEDLEYDELHAEQQGEAKGVHFFRDEMTSIQPRRKPGAKDNDKGKDKGKDWAVRK